MAVSTPLPNDAITSPSSLISFTPTIHQDLVAIAILGSFSSISCALLLIDILYRKFSQPSRTSSRSTRLNLLITNFLFAIGPQSLAFTLSAHWLRIDAIEVSTPACSAQSFFLTSGELASSLSCLLVVLYALSSVVSSYRPSLKFLGIGIFLLWVLVFVCTFTSLGLRLLNSRAGVWCGLSARYTLWLHDVWTLLSAIAMLCAIVAVTRVGQQSKSIDAAAPVVAGKALAYVGVYVLCNLPLIIVRLAQLARRDVPLVALCVAGGMSASLGWMVGLLYVVMRGSGMKEKDEEFVSVVEEVAVEDPEVLRFRPDQEYGTKTVIEANVNPEQLSRSLSKTLSRSISRSRSRSRTRRPLEIKEQGHVELKEVFDLQTVKAETTVHVWREKLDV